jgi:FlaA1/EpsC-like NDP-sugar epimerase
MKVEPPSALPSWSPGLGFRRIILAIPSASAQRRREIITRLTGLGVHVVSIPPLDEVLTGRRRIDQFLELDVNDLLVRDAVAPIPELFERCVAGKTVMVSGAGGSIGSEICRQCVVAGVFRLVLFELSEPALYQIERELRSITEVASGRVTVVPLLGDVRDRRALDKAIAAFDIETIYHAAAYKHVPLVETNIVAGVLNNVFGTRAIVEAAIAAGVKDFVLVSTDKAVNPTNVMGATKRCAELVVQAYAADDSTTRLSMVRFGNVLASSGSVVPLFREQVRKGGPVTVTHPDVTRYFMTIPEAAQLVVQASGIARGGEVFLLDMGKPVRIRDLAVQVIELLGKSVRDDNNPEGDIEIRYTDLRPGEKLYEELLIDAEAQTTPHPKIRRAVEQHMPLAELVRMLDELAAACFSADTDRCRALLRKLVPQYTPSGRNFDWMAVMRDEADA